MKTVRGDYATTFFRLTKVTTIAKSTKSILLTIYGLMDRPNLYNDLPLVAELPGSKPLPRPRQSPDTAICRLIFFWMYGDYDVFSNELPGSPKGTTNDHSTKADSP